MSIKLTPEEIKLRGSLLAKNKDLLKLHKDLVFSNVLSEEEFWEDRKGLLRTQEIIMKQKKGASSALVADDLKPSTASTSDVKYVLTPTIIQTIFEQHPILKKAFSELVGGEVEAKLTEKEFWIEYFKSKFFNESKSANAGSTLLDPFYKETMSESEGQHSLEESSVKVSGQCDISRSEEDHSSDYLRVYPEIQNDSSWNSLRQFNKHSLRVLQCQTTVDAPRELNIEIDDLKVQSAPEMALLNVKESQLFTQSGSKADNSKTAPLASKEEIKSALKGQEAKFDATKFQLNYSKSKEMISSLLERNNFNVGSSHDSKQASLISVDLLEDQIQLINSCTEILRHFWKTASTATATATATATKMHSDKLAKLTRFISVLEKMEGRIGFNGKQNLLECIRQAKFKYNELNK